jgi:hypothetical protein
MGRAVSTLNTITSVYKTVALKLEGTNPLATPRSRWEKNFRTDLEGAGYAVQCGLQSAGTSGVCWWGS